MRFWQKIFLATLAMVLIVVMGACSTLLLITSRVEWENEKLRGMQEMRMLSSVVRSRVEQQALAMAEGQTGRMSPYESSSTDARNPFVSYEEEWMINAVSDTESLNREGDTFYEVYTRQGRCLYSNVPFAFGGVRLDIEQAMNGLTYTLVKRVEGEGSVQYVTSPLTGSLHEYILVMVRELRPLDEVRDHQTNVMTLVGSISAIVVSVIMLGLARFTTSSIQQLRSMTARIAHGEYGKAIEIKSNDEMGELASDFNLMSATIAEHIEELREEADSKEHFIRNLTHELKTPLTSIIGFADLMRRMKLTDDQVAEFADHIYNSGTHLKEISSRLMEWIFLKNNEIQLHTDSLTDLCSQIVIAEQPAYDEKNVLLVLDGQEAYVPMDRTLLRSMITNLLDNALKAVEPNLGVVTLQTGTNRRGEPFFSVSDNGSGIPKDKLKYVTEPFFMVDKARTREHHGAGLGLSLCQEIARVHGATMTIRSKEGAGTFVLVRWRRQA